MPECSHQSFHLHRASITWPQRLYRDGRWHGAARLTPAISPLSTTAPPEHPSFLAAEPKDILSSATVKASRFHVRARDAKMWRAQPCLRRLLMQLQLYYLSVYSVDAFGVMECRVHEKWWWTWSEADTGCRHHPGRTLVIPLSGDWPQCQRCETRRINAHTFSSHTHSHMHTRLLTIPLWASFWRCSISQRGAAQYGSRNRVDPSLR